MNRRSFLKLFGIVAAGIAIGAPNLSIDSIPVRRALLCDLTAIFERESARILPQLIATLGQRSPWMDGTFPNNMGEPVRVVA